MWGNFILEEVVRRFPPRVASLRMDRIEIGRGDTRRLSRGSRRRRIELGPLPAIVAGLVCLAALLNW
jgi:hypothetical protein